MDKIVKAAADSGDYATLFSLVDRSVAAAWRRNSRHYAAAGLFYGDFKADAFEALHSAARTYTPGGEAAFTTYFTAAVIRHTRRVAQKSIASSRGLTSFWTINPLSAPNKVSQYDDEEHSTAPLAVEHAAASAAAEAVVEAVSRMDGQHRVVADALLEGRTKRLSVIAVELGVSRARVSAIYREVIAALSEMPEVACLDLPEKAHWAS